MLNIPKEFQGQKVSPDMKLLTDDNELKEFVSQKFKPEMLERYFDVKPIKVKDHDYFDTSSGLIRVTDKTIVMLAAPEGNGSEPITKFIDSTPRNIYYFLRMCISQQLYIQFKDQD